MSQLNFEYVTRSVVGPGVDPSELDESYRGCECLGECTSASNCCCLLGGNDNFDSVSKKFVHNDDSTIPYLECHQNCECSLNPEKCANRCVQFGVQSPIRVAECEAKGFGVFATELIEKNAFVVEYVGEVISKDEAERRMGMLTNEAHNYLFTIREFIRGECRSTFIDAQYKGNISRFINHSCEPNLSLQVFRLGRVSPSLAMFAVRDIQPGEELSYSYGFLAGSLGALSNKTCLCGATSCQGKLPSATTT